MKKTKSLFCALLNLIPLLLAFLFLYRTGYKAALAAIPIWLIICFINFRLSSGRISYVLFCLLTVFFSGVTEWTATLLYYNKISSDSETLLVGWVLGVFVTLTVIVFSVALLFLKRSDKSKDTIIESSSAERSKHISPILLSVSVVIGAIIAGFAFAIIGGMLWRTIYLFVYLQYIGIAMIFAGIFNIIPVAIVDLWYYISEPKKASSNQ